MMDNKDTAVKVAVRIRPLNEIEEIQDSSVCLTVSANENQIRVGADTYFTFDHVFDPDSSQSEVYDECVEDLLHSAFEGFNATILAYGQTGSGKTFTMGSSSEQIITEDTLGIIPRVIRHLFEMISLREDTEPNCTYKVFVQFLEIYGEDIRDLLDQTRTSKVSIRETRHGEVFITGAKEELVSSYEQMMKSLEDGSKNRTTGSTKMNQTSSRSHAIFTVNLERTTYNSDNSTSEKDEPDVLEVRKCKFHFVDLAGSERLKRTGASGERLKEGIDINKGLLALGNVISALGDEQKRGKVHVPYRDSKLTRMLQDSLGGNSKTLMICCVSPAAINYSESLNALRYANRARNIKNKPVVNRDQTLVLVDELKSTCKLLATELFQMRSSKQYMEVDPRITKEFLQDLISGSGRPNALSPSVTESETAQNSNSRAAKPSVQNEDSKSTNSQLHSKEKEKFSKEIKQLKDLLKKAEGEQSDLKFKLHESETELKRLLDQLKAAKLQCTEVSEQSYLVQSEKDYYKMKYNEAVQTQTLSEKKTPSSPMRKSLGSFSRSRSESSNQLVSLSMDSAPENPVEKQNFIKVLTEHKREIDKLKEELAKAKSMSMFHTQFHNELSVNPAEIDTEFTTTVATLIAQTKQQLQEESRRLNSIEPVDPDDEQRFLDGEDSDDSPEKHKQEEIEESKKFARRQKILNTEFQELGQSIQLKEQLMEQLIKSQQQYTVMKSYYEQKLSILTAAVEEKQLERDKLYSELQDIEKDKNDTSLVKMKEKETKLRSELHLKDEELRNMKKKQEELKSLTQVQSQYSRQLTKLENDISLMKRQRVELSKTLQMEKKNHLLQLNEKVKEIEKLKKELSKASTEMKKLEKSKEIAETRAKDVSTLYILQQQQQHLQQQQQQQQQNQQAGGLSTKNGSSGNLLADKEKDNRGSKRINVPVKPLSISELATAATARAAIREINRHSMKFSSKRLLNEEELKTKKWIDQRIMEISTREAAAEALKKQYEHQLELLKKKERLEQERSLAILQTKTENNGSRSHDHDNDSNFLISGGASFDTHDNSLRKDNQDHGVAMSPSNDQSIDNKSLLLTTHEEEKLLEIIEERIATINGQLNARNQKISDIEKQMNEEGDVPGAEKALEVLKRTAAGSLPAAHELIRLLFDMLVHSNKALSSKLKQLEELVDREKSLTMKNDDLQRLLISEKRNYDMELTTINREYEEKLQKVFQQIASFETIQSTSKMTGEAGSMKLSTPGKPPLPPGGNPELMHPPAQALPPGPPPTTPEQRRLIRPYSNNSIISTSSGGPTGVVRVPSHDKSPIMKYDSLDIQLTIAIEENKFLKSQNDKSALKYAQLRNKCSELENIKLRLIRDVEDKNQQIKFLEEDRALFKEMVEDLKMGLSKLGKDGKAVIQSVKNTANQQKKVGLFSEYLQLSDDGGDNSDDEDTASVIGQFQKLSNEINKNGGNFGGNSSQQSLNSSFSSQQQSKNIYDRLTNPSNYTGSMKNVFENDLEQKRKKIQQFKNSSKKDGSAAGGTQKKNSDGHNKFFPELMKSHSNDELDLNQSGGGGGSSNRRQSSATSHGAGLEVEISTEPVTPSLSSARRKSMSAAIPAGAGGGQTKPPHPQGPPTMRINLDHLSLDDDSLSHSSFETHSQYSAADAISTSSNPTTNTNNNNNNNNNGNSNAPAVPLVSPSPQLNVFTRLAHKPTAASAANNVTPTKASASARGTRHLSPAVNKSLPS